MSCRIKGKEEIILTEKQMILDVCMIEERKEITQLKQLAVHQDV